MARSARLNRLEFLRALAQQLYREMTDLQRGACVPALDGQSLLADPTVAETREAISTAFRRAAHDGATLFIA